WYELGTGGNPHIRGHDRQACVLHLHAPGATDFPLHDSTARVGHVDGEVVCIRLGICVRPGNGEGWTGTSDRTSRGASIPPVNGGGIVTDRVGSHKRRDYAAEGVIASFSRVHAR